MRVCRLVTDDDAASFGTVIILWVALLVILLTAFVINTFVLGVGAPTQTTPSATFGFTSGIADQGTPGGEDDQFVVTITHTEGDTFSAENADRIDVELSPNESVNWPLPVGSGNRYTVVNQSGAISGETISTLAPGETVRVVWTSPDGAKTQTVGAYEIPS